MGNIVPDRSKDSKRQGDPVHVNDLDEFFGYPKETQTLVVGKPRKAKPSKKKLG